MRRLGPIVGIVVAVLESLASPAGAQTSAPSSSAMPPATGITSPAPTPAPAPAPAPSAPLAPPAPQRAISSSDDLEPPTPEELGPAPTTPPAAAAPVNQPPSAEPLHTAESPRTANPVRKLQRLSILGDFGWNSLVGLGPELAFHAHPNFTLEGGAGISFGGWKYGARGRFNLLQRDLTPFVGVGLMHTSGVGLLEINDGQPNSDGQVSSEPTAVVNIRPSNFVQGVVGLDWIDRNSFNLVTCVGYTWLLGGRNIEALSGELNQEQSQVLDAIFGKGVVISLAMGYSLR